jgi:hypothetical protein
MLRVIPSIIGLVLTIGILYVVVTVLPRLLGLVAL